MALTQAQWMTKLVGLLPSWYLTSERVQSAKLQALALLLSTLQGDADYYFKQLFILQADRDGLSAIADERGKYQLPDEPLNAFRQRVRSISNQSPPNHLVRLLNAMLIPGTGTVTMREHDYAQGSPFYSRDLFYSRAIIYTNLIYNAFTIFVPRQVHAPYTFYGRKLFMSRNTYWSNGKTVTALWNSLIQAVRENKVAGTTFRLIERG